MVLALENPTIRYFAANDPSNTSMAHWNILIGLLVKSTRSAVVLDQTWPAYDHSDHVHRLGCCFHMLVVGFLT